MTPRGAARWCAWACVAAMAVSGTPASAQAPMSRHAWEFAGIAGWTGGLSLAGVGGIETQANGNPFPLFAAETRLDGGVGFGATLSRRLAGPVSIEAVGSIDRLTYRTHVTADFEQAALTDATNAAMAFAVGAGIRLTFARRSRVAPFVRGALAWRRELSEDRTLSANGRLVLAGAGITYWIAGPAGGGRVGLRVEVDAVGRSGGLAIGDTMKVSPGFGAGCSLRF